MEEIDEETHDFEKYGEICKKCFKKAAKSKQISSKLQFLGKEISRKRLDTGESLDIEQENFDIRLQSKEDEEMEDEG